MPGLCSTTSYVATPFHTTFSFKLDCIVTHAETNITLCSYMLNAVEEGAQSICVLSDNTDVFVLLVYWTSRMQVVAKIQMEKLNGDWISMKLSSG